MGTEQKAVRIILWIFLVGCMLVLTRYILFKKPSRYYKDFFLGDRHAQVIKRGLRWANLKPFYMIRSLTREGVSSKVVYKNIGGNVIGFMPLGILLPLLFYRLRRWHKTTLMVFLISLTFEITQLITGWGLFDIDDLILNTTGGFLGYMFFYIGSRIFFPEQPDRRDKITPAYLK